MEDAGESGVKLSVGAEMEAYGGQASLGRNLAGSSAISNIEWYNWHGQLKS